MATPAISAATEPIKTDLELEVLIKIADKNTNKRWANCLVLPLHELIYPVDGYRHDRSSDSLERFLQLCANTRQRKVLCILR